MVTLTRSPGCFHIRSPAGDGRKGRSTMRLGKKKLVVLAGVSAAVLLGLNSGPAWAGIHRDRIRDQGKRITTGTCDPATDILAQGGRGRCRGGGPGSDGTGWGTGDSSGRGRGYGAQDGTGSAPRPQDGTGYGAGKGTGSENCDGDGPKGKGSGRGRN